MISFSPSKKINKYFVYFLLMGVCLLAIQSKALADEPKWVLKENPTQNFLCSEGVYCVNPSATINSGSAKISFGIASGGACSPVYDINSNWSDLPQELKPGSSQTTSLALSINQNVPCSGLFTETAEVSLMFGTLIPPEETPGNYTNAGYAKITPLPDRGQGKDTQESAVWIVPEGEQGDLLHVKLSTSMNSGLGGYMTYVYEYQSSEMPSSNKQKAVLESSDDVCAIGVQKTSFRFPNLIQMVSARDSGARFADFSGEVTVASSDDPDNTRPAEIDMVLETGDIIKTEAESVAIISFADMTTFCMKPFSTVILDTPPDKDSKISLLVGKIWMNVKKMVKDGTMNVTMNQAVAGIKGTILVLETNELESTLKVIEGNVQYTATQGGESDMVGKGEMIKADQNGLSEKEKFDLGLERNNWQEFVLGGLMSDAKDVSTSSTPSDNSSIIVVVFGMVMVLVIGGVWWMKQKK